MSNKIIAFFLFFLYSIGYVVNAQTAVDTTGLFSLTPEEVKRWLDYILGISFAILIGFFVLEIAKSAITLATSTNQPGQSLKKATEGLQLSIMGLVVALLAAILLNTIAAVTGLQIAPQSITSNLANDFIDLLNCVRDPQNKCQ